MWYSENVHSIIAGITLGMGCSDVLKYLSFLGLYSSRNKNTLIKLELEVGRVLRDVSKKIFKENMEKEIELTISETSSSLAFNEWIKLDNHHPQKK